MTTVVCWFRRKDEFLSKSPSTWDAAGLGAGLGTSVVAAVGFLREGKSAFFGNIASPQHILD